MTPTHTEPGLALPSPDSSPRPALRLIAFDPLNHGLADVSRNADMITVGRILEPPVIVVRQLNPRVPELLPFRSRGRWHRLPRFLRHDRSPILNLPRISVIATRIMIVRASTTESIPEIIRNGY